MTGDTQKPLVRRIRCSTWIVALLAACVMVVVEIPGRRTGAMTYSHGWPLAYLERDYRPDTAANPFLFNVLVAPSSLADVSNEKRLLEHSAETDDREYQTINEVWAVSGLCMSSERGEKLNPWSYVNVKRRALFWIVPDVCAALALVVAAAVVWQWLRVRMRLAGRSRFQFRLRTLLITVGIVGIALARFAAWRKELNSEKANPNAIIPNETTWCPPDWLPESLAKLGIVSKDFERITCCWLDCQNGSEESCVAAVSKVKAYPCLREVRLVNCRLCDAAFARLAQLPRLCVLQLPDADLSDPMLDEISKLSSLTALEIRCDHVSEKGIDALKRLPKLHFLRLRNISDQRFADRLGELSNLEGLALLGPKVARVHLRGMKYLRQFVTDTPLDVVVVGAPPPAQLGSLWLEDLPALESVRLWYTAFSDVRLSNLPELREFESSQAALPVAAVDQCLRASKLQRLALSDVEISGRKRIAWAGASRLDRLEVDGINSLSHRPLEFEFRDVNNLEELTISFNPGLGELHFGLLPKLKELEVIQNLKLSTIDLGGLPALESLGVTAVELMAIPPRLRNLRNLARLKELALLSIRLDRALLDDIAHLGGLQSLTLSHGCVNGQAVEQLAPLRRLTELNLGYNDLDNSAVSALARVPANMQLNIDSNPIDDSAVDRLKKLRPDLDISINSRKDAMSDFQHQIASGATAIQAPAFVFGDGDLGLLIPAADRLKHLNLRDAHITDVGMATVAKLTHLEWLDLQGTQITDAGLAQLAVLHELRAINLSGTAIVGPGLRYLRALPKLTTLCLPAVGVTDDSLANLRFVPQVERLSLMNTEIGDAGLIHLAAMPHLRVLDLQSTRVTDAGLEHLSKVPSLEALRLGPYAIDGAGIEHLRSLPIFATLDVSTLSATDALLEHVAHLPHLQSLILGDCNAVSDRGVAIVQQMDNLRKLYLASANTPDRLTRIPGIQVIGAVGAPSTLDDEMKVEKEFEPFLQEKVE